MIDHGSSVLDVDSTAAGGRFFVHGGPIPNRLHAAPSA
jgi:hypothetical protein